ncbi:hypothetical protein SNE40_002176 [Patella caerulea]|uniref:G-protein coupled receptors family 1 profile domain-containing protein n=1 Tax=Patella caerulea TaxID=87958 RepID=A0AAN8K5K3_PATCE
MANNTTDINCVLDLSEAELPILLVLTLIFNSVSLLILNRMKVLTETIDHLLVTTLTYNDMISTLLYTFMWLGSWISCGQMLQNITCDIFGWLGTITVIWSAGIVVVMSGCRYLALVRPLYYRLHVNAKSVKIGLVGFLALFLVMVTFPLVGLASPYYYYSSNMVCAYNFTPGDGGLFHRCILGVISVFGLLTVLVILFFNISIVGQIRKTASVGHSYPTKMPSVLKNKRTAITSVTLVVSLVYVLTYGPFLGRVLYDVIYNIKSQDRLDHSITMALLFLSPLLNPIMYVLFNKKHRACLMRLIKSVCAKITCRNSIQENSITENDGKDESRGKV